MAYDISKNAKLKGRIIEIYGSQIEFAKAIGVTDTTVNYKLNGKRDLSQDDIAKWVKALKIPTQEIGAYFFAN